MHRRNRVSMREMTERDACAVLKARFEAAGLRIEENRPFDEDGIQFEIDGFDSDRRVGYEYVTEEAGDGWDVDGTVIAALAKKHEAGELHVLVVNETVAPDRAAIEREAEAFLSKLQKAGVLAREKTAKKPAPKRARAAKKSR